VGNIYAEAIDSTTSQKHPTQTHTTFSIDKDWIGRPTYWIKHMIISSNNGEISRSETECGIQPSDIEDLKKIQECLCLNTQKEECEKLNKYKLYKEIENIASMVAFFEFCEKNKPE